MTAQTLDWSDIVALITTRDPDEVKANDPELYEKVRLALSGHMRERDKMAKTAGLKSYPLGITPE